MLNAIRLRAADGRPNANYCAERLVSVQISQLAVGSPARRIDELAHLESRGAAARPVVRLVCQCTRRSASDVGKPVERCDFGADITPLFQPAVDEPASERIGKRIRKYRRKPCILAPRQLGKRLLYEMASPACSLWENRIAIVTTMQFIRHGEFSHTLAIADRLMTHPHDLIHKAVGWMLREVGKRDREILEAYLKPRLATMPRTMLRYAIERFPEPLRKSYLTGRDIER